MDGACGGREEEEARLAMWRAKRAASSSTQGAGEAGGAKPWAQGKGMGKEGGGVSQAMATEPTARTGETGAGEGTSTSRPYMA